MVCDGCRVNRPHEHRCHRSGCECEDCRAGDEVARSREMERMLRRCREFLDGLWYEIEGAESLCDEIDRVLPASPAA